MANLRLSGLTLEQVGEALGFSAGQIEDTRHVRDGSPRRAVQRRPVVLVQAAQATERPGSHCGRRYFSDWCGAVKAIEFAVTPTSPRFTLSIVGGSSFPGGGVAAPSVKEVPSSRVAVSESR